MIRSADIKEFTELRNQYTIVDVRSEIEFSEGHIPGAVNIPILNTEERVQVGTMEKKSGRQLAVLKGLELSGPNLKDRVKNGVKLLKDNKLLVHCWRGGMRSEFFAFLMHYYGAEPIVLNGGYKSYRTEAHRLFDEFPYTLNVVAGRTGTGKTVLLQTLREKGEQVLDLEYLAKHRGSAFGGLAFNTIPTQEQFENELFDEISKFDVTRSVWIEDEGRTIGRKVIPAGIWGRMCESHRFVVNRSYNERLDLICGDYGNFAKEDLIEAMNRIGKRLGPQHVKKAVELLENGETKRAFEVALVYYDKAYDHLISQHDTLNRTDVDGESCSWEAIADNLINSSNAGRKN